MQDLSLNEMRSLSKGTILKLPTKEASWDFGYENPKGILYFIDSKLTHDVMKYHPSLNKKGKMNIPKTSFEDSKFWYKSGFEIGNVFWMMGKIPQTSSGYTIYLGTKFWFKKKEKFGKGPSIPDENHNKLTLAPSICGTGNNFSSGFVVGLGIHENGVALFDLLFEKWVNYPILPFNSYRCSCTLIFKNKSSEK